MARSASGIEQVEAALLSMKLATSADELRIAQAVLLPLQLGLTLHETAQAIGRSVGAECVLRRSSRHPPVRPAQDGPAQSGQSDMGARGGCAGQSHARCQSGWCGHHPAPAAVD